MVDDQLEILRRIADRGMNMAHDLEPSFIDIFQHLLDEIERTKLQLANKKIYDKEN